MTRDEAIESIVQCALLTSAIERLVEKAKATLMAIDDEPVLKLVVDNERDD